MIFIKNKLLILILVTYVLPLGGIGVSAIGNMHTINPENEIYEVVDEHYKKKDKTNLFYEEDEVYFPIEDAISPHY